MTRMLTIILSALFFIFTSTVLALPTKKFYGGFELGIGNETLQYSNAYNLIGSAYPVTVNYTTPFNHDVSSYIFTGGLMLGYAQSFNGHFGVNYELLAMGNSGNLSATDQMQSPFTYTPAALQEYTAKTSLNLNYAFDFAVKPTVALSNDFTGYLKAGLSNAGLTSSLDITHNNALTNEAYTETSGKTDENVWGYVLGVGLEFALSQRCSLFGEYNFHQYQKTALKTVMITDNGSGALPGESVSNTITYTRKVLPYINSLNVGIHYYF